MLPGFSDPLFFLSSLSFAFFCSQWVSTVTSLAVHVLMVRNALLHKGQHRVFVVPTTPDNFRAVQLLLLVLAMVGPAWDTTAPPTVTYADALAVVNGVLHPLMHKLQGHACFRLAPLLPHIDANLHSFHHAAQFGRWSTQKHAARFADAFNAMGDLASIQAACICSASRAYVEREMVFWPANLDLWQPAGLRDAEEEEEEEEEKYVAAAAAASPSNGPGLISYPSTPVPELPVADAPLAFAEAEATSFWCGQVAAAVFGTPLSPVFDIPFLASEFPGELAAEPGQEQAAAQEFAEGAIAQEEAVFLPLVLSPAPEVQILRTVKKEAVPLVYSPRSARRSTPSRVLEKAVSIRSRWLAVTKKLEGAEALVQQVEAVLSVVPDVE